MLKVLTVPNEQAINSHDPDEDVPWFDGPREPWQNTPQRLRLQGLKPDTHYEIRIVLNDLEHQQSFTSEKIPSIIVTTLCKPVGNIL